MKKLSVLMKKKVKKNLSGFGRKEKRLIFAPPLRERN